MTDNNTTNDSGADNGSSAVALDSPDAQADASEDLPEFDDASEDVTEIAVEDLDEDAGVGSGAVSGGFGLAGLALAVVSLTTSWTSGVVVSHSQYSEEMNGPSSGLTVQQELNMYASSWHTQAWWAFAFAAAAVLFGAGALLAPKLLRSRRIPGWAKAAATGAIIVGVVGIVLAVLTLTGVLGGHLTAPASAS